MLEGWTDVGGMDVADVPMGCFFGCRSSPAGFGDGDAVVPALPGQRRWLPRAGLRREKPAQRLLGPGKMSARVPNVPFFSQNERPVATEPGALSPVPPCAVTLGRGTQGHAGMCEVRGGSAGMHDPGTRDGGTRDTETRGTGTCSARMWSSGTCDPCDARRCDAAT